MIGRWHALVIDCEQPDTAAAFYQELLGMIRVQEARTGFRSATPPTVPPWPSSGSTGWSGRSGPMPSTRSRCTST